VEIQGHTDSNGDDSHNQGLSEDRANAVRNWLIAHGVSSDRLEAKGYGEQHPLVPNVTEGNRQKNRRVQFIIVDQEKQVLLPAGAQPPK
jgi:outer membrane protein OmpA-like peptidoglycan-associated protein